MLWISLVAGVGGKKQSLLANLKDPGPNACISTMDQLGSCPGAKAKLQHFSRKPKPRPIRTASIYSALPSLTVLNLYPQVCSLSGCVCEGCFLLADDKRPAG